MIPTFNKTRSFFSTIEQGKVKNAQDKLAGNAGSAANVIKGGTQARTDAAGAVNTAANKVDTTAKAVNLTQPLGSTAVAAKSEVITSGATPVVVPVQSTTSGLGVDSLSRNVEKQGKIEQKANAGATELDNAYKTVGNSDSESINTGYTAGNKSIDETLKSGNAQGNMSTGVVDVEAEQAANLLQQDDGSNIGLLNNAYGKYFKNSEDAYARAADSNILQQQFNDARNETKDSLRNKAVAQSNLERQLGGLDKTGKDSKELLNKEKIKAEDLSKKNLGTIKSSADTLRNIAKDAVIKAGDNKKEIDVKTETALGTADENLNKYLKPEELKLFSDPITQGALGVDLSMSAKYKSLTDLGYDDAKARKIMKDKFNVDLPAGNPLENLKAIATNYTPEIIMYAKERFNFDQAKTLDEKIKILESAKQSGGDGKVSGTNHGNSGGILKNTDISLRGGKDTIKRIGSFFKKD